MTEAKQGGRDALCVLHGIVVRGHRCAAGEPKVLHRNECAVAVTGDDRDCDCGRLEQKP